jgi:hypothetical protein
MNRRFCQPSYLEVVAYQRLRELNLEPPSRHRLSRLIHSAVHRPPPPPHRFSLSGVGSLLIALPMFWLRLVPSFVAIAHSPFTLEFKGRLIDSSGTIALETYSLLPTLYSLSHSSAPSTRILIFANCDRSRAHWRQLSAFTRSVLEIALK